MVSGMLLANSSSGRRTAVHVDHSRMEMPRALCCSMLSLPTTTLTIVLIFCSTTGDVCMLVLRSVTLRQVEIESRACAVVV